MDERIRPGDEVTPPNGAPHPRRPTGESLELVLRILRRNHELVDGTATASGEGEAAVGAGRTVSSDPSSGVTRGDFSND
jgi:hypothetical protein